MEPHGFIRDKLDLKILILYVLSRANGPLTFETLYDLTFCDDGVNYFTFCECVPELVEAGQMAKNEDGLYTCTPAGSSNCKICEDSIAFSVRQKALAAVENYNQTVRRNTQIQGKWIRRGSGAYSVIMSLSDETENLMTLELMAGSEKQAELISGHFKKHAGTIFRDILGCVLPNSKSDGSA